MSPLPSVFARVKGKSGTRELRAIISPLSDLTVICLRDALQLGYEVVWRSPTSSVVAITPGGIMQAAKLVLDEVSIGTRLVSKSVESLAYELPEPSGADMILGKSFLKAYRLNFDLAMDVLTIEEPNQ